MARSRMQIMMTAIMTPLLSGGEKADTHTQPQGSVTAAELQT